MWITSLDTFDLKYYNVLQIKNNHSTMRSVINISLSNDFADIVERAVKSEHFSSKSEFFRHLLREWLAGRLASKVEEGRQEHAAGRTKELGSVSDL